MAAGIKYHPHWQQTHAVTVKRGFRETPITNAPLEPQTPNQLASRNPGRNLKLQQKIRV